MLTVLLYVVALGQLVLGQAPQVTTSQGTMRGQVLKSRDGRDYFSFTKIPYAKPPIGEWRFMVPIEANNWTGILDATQPIPACYQPTQLAPTDPPQAGQEDCLYLNVFSPNLTAKYPVIYSIHGGGFAVGTAGDFGHARYFMDEDVVFVAANYRLGTLGFLSMEDIIVPGNMGLKDQALALEWVHREISKFGGDPNRITVIGESAGGASTDIICSAPRTNGLVKACVSQSGVVSSSTFPKPGAARKSAMNLAKALGCNVTDVDVVKCLQSKPLEQVGNSSLLAVIGGASYAGPVLEHPDAPQALLTRWPTGTNHGYPWIIGVCQDEALILTLPYELNQKTEEEREEFINSFNQTVISTYHLEKRTKDLERIRERFFKEGLDPVRAIRNYFTETYFVYPSLRSLSEHPGPTFFYKFNYTRGPKMHTFNMSALGVPHASELPYFFEPNEQLPPDWPNPDDIALSKKMVKMWVNFATDQDPSIKSTTQWPQFQGRYFLDIHDSGISINNWTDYQETLDFWKSIERSSGTMSRSSFLSLAALCIFTIFKAIII